MNFQEMYSFLIRYDKHLKPIQKKYLSDPCTKITHLFCGHKKKGKICKFKYFLANHLVTNKISVHHVKTRITFSFEKI